MCINNIYPSISYFKDSLVISLTSQHKKIVAVVALILVFIGAAYLTINHYLRKIKNEDLGEGWWNRINGSKRLQDFKKDWKSWIADRKACVNKTKELKEIYKTSELYKQQDRLMFDAPLGRILQVPDNFSMWMPGVAFIASYLAEKKNMQGLFICQSLEAFGTKVDEIALSKGDKRIACVVGTIQSGFGLQPNFPQHKIAVGIEKKGGQLRIALLESMPLPVFNEPDPNNLMQELWDGNYNGQELIFRAVLKACCEKKCEVRLLYSVVERQKVYGCVIFALQSAISFLNDENFFNRITCEEEKSPLDSKFKLEKITQLPPEFMTGLQSQKFLQNYEDEVGHDRFNEPLLGKTKTLQSYLDENQLDVDGTRKSFINFYVLKKHFKYLNFFVEATKTLPPRQIQQVIDKTLITKINYKLFPGIFRPECMMDEPKSMPESTAHYETAKRRILIT